MYIVPTYEKTVHLLPFPCMLRKIGTQNWCAAHLWMALRLCYRARQMHDLFTVVNINLMLQSALAMHASLDYNP